MSTAVLSRRTGLRAGAVALGAGIAIPALAGTAEAKGNGPRRARKKKQKKAVSYKAGRYAATPLLSDHDRHLAARFSYGLSTSLVAEILATQGGARAWFDAQIDTAYDGTGDGLCDWWPYLREAPAAVLADRSDGKLTGYTINQQYARRTMCRRIVSPKQVLEVMTEFWENHFHVTCGGDDQWFVFRAAYGDMIRRNALGRFTDLLQNVVTHPAMAMFLGNSDSTKDHPNENLGRELLELHTVGVGNYTEDDVKDSARILTGFKVTYPSVAAQDYATTYSTKDHATGPVTVMTFTDPNAAADGRPVVQAYLDYLAHHPDTAAHLARKLAIKFVNDNPTDRIVADLAQVYLDNDTAIAPVLRALVDHPDFTGDLTPKLRDGGEDVANTYRALGVTIRQPTGWASAAIEIYSQVNGLGLATFAWPRPDGAPIDSASNATPARLMASSGLHWAMATHKGPQTGVAYRSAAHWIPAERIVFRDLVDHLSRSVLQRPSTSVLLQACCLATGIEPGDVVTQAHAQLTSTFGEVLATVLDHPYHYER